MIGILQMYHFSYFNVMRLEIEIFIWGIDVIKEPNHINLAAPLQMSP